MSTAPPTIPSVTPDAVVPATSSLASRAGRVVGFGVLASMVAGVASAVVARVLMRLATEVVDGEPSFSVAGTLGIVMIYVVALTPGAVASVATRRWPRWVALGAGAAFLALASVNIAVQEDLDAVTDSTSRIVLMVVVALGFVAGLVGHVWLLARLGDRWRRPRGAAASNTSPAEPALDTER